ncbi:MAG: YabP/YqfC family sporulation protein [Clostridia bacterium]|nr:YabP/YqfC family sporulation protein [Clostridia bacterium]
MQLWKEIFTQLNDGEGVDATGITGLSYTVWEGKGGYFQNVKSLGGFSPQEILLVLRRGSVRVIGQDLSVAKYFENDVLLKGNILSVVREGV